MGQNLILNMNDHGFVVCAFNRTVDKVQQFLNNEAKGTKVIGATSLQDMVSKLKTPRKVMLLVKGNRIIPYQSRSAISFNWLHAFSDSAFCDILVLTIFSFAPSWAPKLSLA